VINMICQYKNCNKEFIPKTIKSKFCSEKCRRQVQFSRLKTNRKELLVNKLGGKCSKCGYSKCIDALQFHHINPKDKHFELKKENMLKGINSLLKELTKCILVCANCHIEIHNEMRSVKLKMTGDK